jgi:NADPH:quinone reductase-like Zn-dependent oxidoreductase
MKGEAMAGLSGLALRSRITAGGKLELWLEEGTAPDPAADEVVLRVEAAPINPSDLGLLLGPADVSTLQFGGTAERPIVTGTVPKARLAGVAGRLDAAMPVGNEGAGTVVAAGANARALEGRVVAALGGGMYAQYRVLKAADCLVLPEGIPARAGASAFVNPLTALGMVETMHREGHTAPVHTAAASNLGQMLSRICLADGIPLVNIVRNAQQAEVLRGIGAKYVLDSTSPGFAAELTEALAETGATLAFDAIGGGTMAGTILAAMEAAQSRKLASYSRYGSSVHKQVYIYGSLDPGPKVIAGNFGMAWGVGGWLVTSFLRNIGREGAERLRARVVAELTTTFASHYTAEISLAEALSRDAIAAYSRRATGEKYLINPNRTGENPR